jgi:hypothetical protein
MQPQDPFSIEALNHELSGAVNNLSQYHANMQAYCDYYEKSAFYPMQAGESQRFTIADNYLQVFADKNIHYTSEMPEFKVAGTPEDRENANIREKILYAVHRSSGTKLLQKRWARDATKKSIAISEVVFDMETRRVKVNRYDPRHVFWKMSNGNSPSVTAFWAVFPITRQECMEKYGVTPTRETISTGILAKQDPFFNHMDGQDWFTMAIRWDEKIRVAWCGDVLIEEPHEHNMGSLPVDVCAPFMSESKHRLGDFYLQRLLQMQAELNDTVRRRSNIVKRMSNPIIWGKNIQTRTYDDVKAALKNAETGVLGLGKDGEVGILQLQEIKMLYEHESALKSDMQRLSGFAAASFGESVGANTSGDALGMYFTPTQKHIDDQNISWVSFYESINAKILCAYDRFGRTGEKFTLDGYAPQSTLVPVNDEGSYTVQRGGGYHLEFTNEVINGNYISRAIMPPVIPKNELAEMQAWAGWAKDGIVSRTTAYEKLGLESPEDEKALLMLEKSEPLLNPEGTSQILQGMQNMPMPGGAPAPALPPPPQLAAQVS